MAYIGVDPNTNISTTKTTQTFNGNGSQTVFTLSSAPVSAANCLVAVGGVFQTAGINYSVSGTTLTFLTGAPPSGTSNIAVTY